MQDLWENIPATDRQLMPAGATEEDVKKISQVMALSGITSSAWYVDGYRRAYRLAG